MAISPASKPASQDALTQGFQGLALAVPQLPRLADHVSRNGFTGGIQSYDEAHMEWVTQLLASIAQNYTAKTN